MSETFETTRAAIQRLKKSLREADEDTRYSFAFWLIGLAMMAAAIVAALGWPGVIFCAGAIVWAAGNSRNH